MVALTGLGVAMTAVFTRLLVAPFWFDEASRAYQIALPGLHTGAGASYAPLSLGWLFGERALIQVLPTTELVLRLPELIAYLALGPAFYVLARRLMPRIVAFLVTAMLISNPVAAYYGTQLKAYAVEALATVLLILVWQRARGARPRAATGWYAAIAAISLFSIPAPFVVAPLFAIDVVGVAMAHRRSLVEFAEHAAGPALAGAALLVYNVTFVLPQGFAAGYSAWAGFLPPHGLAPLWRFVRVLEPTYLVGAVTGANALDTRHIGFVHTGVALADGVKLLMSILLVAGILARWRCPVGRGVIAVGLGGLALQFAASLAHRWPFGLTRADVFFVPVIYLLAGAGVAAIARHTQRGSRWRLAAGAVLAATVVAAVGAGVNNVRDAGRVIRRVPIIREMQGIRQVVAAARREYRPGTLAYLWLDGRFRFGPHGKGWTFYMSDYEWSGPTGNAPRVPPGDTYFAGSWSAPEAELASYLAHHVGASRLLVAGAPAFDPVLSRAGFRMIWSRAYPATCVLSVWVRTRQPAGSLTTRRSRELSGSRS